MAPDTMATRMVRTTDLTELGTTHTTPNLHTVKPTRLLATNSFLTNVQPDSHSRT
jgi:hypothetical protein